MTVQTVLKLIKMGGEKNKLTAIKDLENNYSRQEVTKDAKNIRASFVNDPELDKGYLQGIVETLFELSKVLGLIKVLKKEHHTKNKK